ncbi:coproporphyrinogen III oxidase [Sulfurimonas sp. SWIR-19]|uniref:coproporphyrinogen III oxidase n=1 Tax=Sulfurimonas sp. SWIR-19 TaxID=2878390 RepID=UPI001CF4608C|nr:coproporphyrinogen III oxidase [Sulfurimonas sp. SWIR-19]UCM99509.1 coproporphyrinogen III oxidase [Sulfurimonas sp. SWIR-19]
MAMNMTNSKEAQQAYKQLTALQQRFVNKLDALSEIFGENKKFQEVIWLRDEGKHGGGSRFEARDKQIFNTASVNVSQVHYDDMPEKNLKSATAISTIIHPNNPHVPSVHIHISLTELRNAPSYWRIMADLNPAVANEEDKTAFDKALQNLGGKNYTTGAEQGDKYFTIPALQRTRGISHFYLENYKTDNKQADVDFAKNFGEGIIDTYINIITNALQTRTEISKEALQQQLDYHTLYLFQVLTLDRGTTSGLLIHDQNDIGIMGSLPLHVNKALLLSWKNKMQKPQDELVQNIADTIADNGVIDTLTKEKLAKTVRAHYKKYPQALSMQASGNTIPNTVGNHKN